MFRVDLDLPSKITFYRKNNAVMPSKYIRQVGFFYKCYISFCIQAQRTADCHEHLVGITKHGQRGYWIKLGNQKDGDYKLVKMLNYVVYLLHV